VKLEAITSGPVQSNSERVLTSSGVSKLCTDYLGIRTAKEIIAHGSPDTVEANFHSSFVTGLAINKSDLTMSTVCRNV